MLPDFASMAGFRLAPGQPEPISQGIAFHHHSDKAFHGLKSFRDLESWTLQQLTEAGFRRGPARGVAHVGVELCLDGSLIGQADAMYLSALESATSSVLQWKKPEDASAFDRLVARLLEIGTPRGYQDPSVVCRRLVQILGPRPLLALDERETPLLHEAMPAVHKRVEDNSALIMSSLRSEL
jgi:hypothetical protein